MSESPGQSVPGQPGRTFAERLEYLFGTVYPAGGEPYKNSEVAAAISEDGESISSTYIWMLRTNRRTNPTMRHIAALAKFFGVPASYFFDDDAADEITKQLSILSAARTAGVKEILYRSTQLADPDRDAVLRILRSLGEKREDGTDNPAQ